MTETERFPTPESLDETSIPHPFFAQAVKDLRAAHAAGNAPKPDYAPEVLQRAREGRKQQLDKVYATAPPGVKESIVEVEMRDGFKAQNRLFQPEKPTGPSPLILLVHGGGFAMGENRAQGPLARGLVLLFDAVVVSLHYRLAPENPFPTGVNDCWDSFVYFGANAGSLGADPSAGFVVGGVSAGGNISAIITAQATAQGLCPPVTGTWLSVPFLFHNVDDVPEEFRPFYKSMEQNAVVPVLDAKAIGMTGVLLKPDVQSPWYTPLNFKGDIVGHPPTYIQVDGMDPLRDDGVIYEKVLRKRGVKTRLDVWPGLPHAHMSFFADKDFGKSATNDTVRGIAWLLGKTEPGDDDIQVVVVPSSTAN